MPSRAATQSAANSDIEEPSNTATSDTRKRKASAAKGSSAKKTTTTKRKTSKTGNSDNGTPLREDGQADRDDSLDAEDDEDDEDDDGASKTAGGASGKPKVTNRKAQNRNAQRESRQRKAEYVKALEGFVALHKVDMSSQLQGLLFAIGLLIDENMKLRATLGAVSSLFVDPTQGSRLPDVGIDIHALKEAVERNDKSYLLDLGEMLRDRVGMHSREAHAVKVVNQSQKTSTNAFTQPTPMLNMVDLQARKPNEENSPGEAPIFGRLTARAENELLEKIRLSGESFDSGGLGMLSTPGSPPKMADKNLQNQTNESKATADRSELPKPAPLEELTRAFQRTSKMDTVAESSPVNRPANPSLSHEGQGSSTGTPVDFNQYLHTHLLNSGGGYDELASMDINQFLFPNGPSPPGFQMPDFTSLGMNMPSYNLSNTAPYPTNTFNAIPGSFLHPTLQNTAPSPALGLPSGPSSFLKDSPSEGYAHPAGLSTFTSLSSASPAGTSSSQLQALKDTSKTLHKQARQLIKFHLRARQEDSTHDLPAALESTAAQGVMSHDSRIDAVLWPAMRDRLIFSSGKIDLQGVLQSLESEEAVIVHATGDLMDPSAWELSESFVRAYPGVLDGEILKACNKWRLARGETQIAL